MIYLTAHTHTHDTISDMTFKLFYSFWITIGHTEHWNNSISDVKLSGFLLVMTILDTFLNQFKKENNNKYKKKTWAENKNNATQGGLYHFI